MGHADRSGTGIAANAKGPLFRAVGRNDKLTGNPLHHLNAYEMVCKGAAAAGVQISIGNHSFHAVGITVFRKLGGPLENAALAANPARTRTTQFLDRRSDDVALDEIARKYSRRAGRLHGTDAAKTAHRVWRAAAIGRRSAVFL
jgi:hypothetical protein